MGFISPVRRLVRTENTIAGVSGGSGTKRVSNRYFEIWKRHRRAGNAIRELRPPLTRGSSSDDAATVPALVTENIQAWIFGRPRPGMLRTGRHLRVRRRHVVRICWDGVDSGGGSDAKHTLVAVCARAN
jgi:hypothetical protein